MRPLPGRTSTEPERRSSRGGGGADDDDDDDEDPCIDDADDDNASAAPMPPPLLAQPAAATSSTSPSRDSIAWICIEKPLRRALASGGAISEGPRLLANLSFRASSSFFEEKRRDESGRK